MQIQINQTLQACTDPLTQVEYEALEKSLLADGCRDALVLWNEVLVDGHNRYAICSKHAIEFRTIQHAGFGSLEDAQLWMIENHLARRSVSDFQRGMLALKKKGILDARAKLAEPAADAADGAGGDAPAAPAAPRQTRDEVARLARISPTTLNQIEKIQKTASPELVQAVRAGTISITAAAAVASLPEDEQKAAVASGRKELQQLARHVRERRTPLKPKAEALGVSRMEAAVAPGTMPTDVAVLQAKLRAVMEENESLREKLAGLAAENAALRGS